MNDCPHCQQAFQALDATADHLAAILKVVERTRWALLQSGVTDQRDVTEGNT
jgi:hypothetical protein